MKKSFRWSHYFDFGVNISSFPLTSFFLIVQMLLTDKNVKQKKTATKNIWKTQSIKRESVSNNARKMNKIQ